MKKILIFAVALFLTTLNLHARIICVDIKNKQNLFDSFAKELISYSEKHYGVSNFTIDQNSKTIKGEKTFKIKRRKNQIIGTIKESFKKKPKWKKEKIEIKGEIDKDKACVEVSLTAYNKRTKKWHKLESDNMLEEHMAAFLLTEALKGKKFWSIGNISVEKNGLQKRVLNLTEFTVEAVDISIDPSSGIKSVNFLLSNNGDSALYRVLMLGNIKDINSAFKEFKKHFLDFNPAKKTSKIYQFYWEYAKRGEIMDGMHKLQLITALGFPDKTEKKKDNSEIFFYNFNGKIYKYTIVKNELNMNND